MAVEPECAGPRCSANCWKWSALRGALRHAAVANCRLPAVRLFRPPTGGEHRMIRDSHRRAAYPDDAGGCGVAGESSRLNWRTMSLVSRHFHRRTGSGCPTTARVVVGFVGSWELYKFGVPTTTSEKRSLAHDPYDVELRRGQTCSKIHQHVVTAQRDLIADGIAQACDEVTYPCTRVRSDMIMFILWSADTAKTDRTGRASFQESRDQTYESYGNASAAGVCRRRWDHTVSVGGGMLACIHQ